MNARTQVSVISQSTIVRLLADVLHRTEFYNLAKMTAIQVASKPVVRHVAPLSTVGRVLSIQCDLNGFCSIHCVHY